MMTNAVDGLWKETTVAGLARIQNLLNSGESSYESLQDSPAAWITEDEPESNRRLPRSTSKTNL